MIYIENKKRKIENIQKQYPNGYILDVTSASPTRYARILSPFYPHGNIPIPFTKGLRATCVEAVWQGLKVFKSCDVDLETFKNDTMKGLKRTVKRFGAPLGHRKGVHGKDILNYFDARMQIYIPTYKWVLDNIPEVHNVVTRIKEKSRTNDIILLDYNTNDDFRDTSLPLSHASLIKLYIEGRFPQPKEKYKPLTPEEIKEKKEAREKAKDSKETDRKDKKHEQLNLF